MAGTFSSFGNALSALRYNRVVMDVASGNVANASSEGYVRRRVAGEAVGAPAQTAMWARYEGQGDGVRVLGLERLSDTLLDARARAEHSSRTYLDVRSSVLQRFETGVGEPGENGVSAAMDELRTAWHDLANNPGGDAARSQLLARAGVLAASFGVQARNVASEASAQRVALTSAVTEANTLASDLATTNRSIAVATFNGDDASVLMDRRDALAMRISELTGAVATVRADGGLDMAVGGVPLVAGKDAGRLVVTAGIADDGSADGSPVALAVELDGVETPVAGLKGDAGARVDLLNTTLPAYAEGLGAVARRLAEEVNAQHAQGYDKDGVAGGPLFTFDEDDPAGTLAVAITDVREVAASSVPGGGLDGGNADALGRLEVAGEDYQRLINGLGTEVASVRRLALNQDALTKQVDGTREQLSGVNLDEEMVTMLQAQRAYEAAARVMSTVDSMLDTLINRMGS
ncbi:flagellar hook-associated protein FlgK [Nocardioides perillae]|uniref:Flagellar hook-associated protein 1 n=1 Tax=Nocardioides perillae TaxID=1119534 RepID=A0A7Y9RYD9_9ACTN|nr:flagellar hook-associated protein FlgK [Nocardioides perillae]NYG57018.1 flagellar hook-associated protein 1 FlgK [Nocardioides perillae]